MPTKILRGDLYRDFLAGELAGEIRVLRGPVPGLGVVLVGDDGPSTTYVGKKEQLCRQVGMHFRRSHLSAQAGEGDITQAVFDLNEDPLISGIVLQVPLPMLPRETRDDRDKRTDRIIQNIDPAKDADGNHPDTIRKFLAGEAFAPVLAEAALRLVELSGVPLAGKRAAIVGKRMGTFEVIAKELNGRQVLVGPQIMPWNVAVVADQLCAADILVTFGGKAGLIGPEHVKPGAIVVDIGINFLASGKMVGDVQFDEVVQVAGWVTPVPRGVGPVTVGIMLWRVYQLHCLSRDLPVPEIPTPTWADLDKLQQPGLNPRHAADGLGREDVLER